MLLLLLLLLNILSFVQHYYTSQPVVLALTTADLSGKRRHTKPESWSWHTGRHWPKRTERFLTARTFATLLETCADRNTTDGTRAAPRWWWRRNAGHFWRWRKQAECRHTLEISNNTHYSMTICVVKMTRPYTNKSFSQTIKCMIFRTTRLHQTALADPL